MNGIEKYYSDLKNSIVILPDDIEFCTQTTNLIKDSHNPDVEDLMNPINSWLTFFKYAYCPLCNFFAVGIRYGFYDEDSLSILDKFFPRRIKYRATEIYDIISKVSNENAMLIIDRISETSDVYEQLCEAYESNDKTAFVKAILDNKLNTSSVKNICYLFSGFDFPSQTETPIDFKRILKTGIPPMTPRQSQKMLYQYSQIPESSVKAKKIISIPFEMLAIQKKLTTLFVNFINEASFDDEDHLEENQSYADFISNWRSEWNHYENDFVTLAKKTFFILLGAEPQFSYQEQEIFDEMVTRPEVAEYFRQWREDYAILSREKTKSRDTKANASGRKQVIWLIEGHEAELNRWNTYIQTKVWPKVCKYVSSYKYNKTTPKKLEKAINNMGASLIYKAAEDIGIAKEYAEYDVASSYARTMSFIGCERRAFKPYMEMLDIYVKYVEQYKQNNFESRHRSYGNENGSLSRRNYSYNENWDSVDPREIIENYARNNPEMAELLQENMKEIGESLIKIRQLLSTNK